MADRDEHHLKISWSQLRAHSECKQKAFLYREGHRGPGQDLRGYYHGMVVDTAMRAWLADPDRHPGQMADRIDAVIDQGIADARAAGDGVVRWKSATDRHDMRDFCVELVTRLEPMLERFVLPYPYDCAYRFSVDATVPYLDGTPTVITLVGEMDLFVHPGDTHVIWDLKGTKDNAYWRKVIGQLVFYDIAALSLTGQPPHYVGLIQPMCEQRTLTFTVSDDDRRVMWARVLSVANDRWHQDHACKTDTTNCTWCDVKHACARYQPTGGTVSLLGAGLRTAIQEDP